MSAWQELKAALEPEETVEAIVFGPWGWGEAPNAGESWEPGHGEAEPPAVPFEKRGFILKPEEAEPFMQSWQFSGGHGAPKCYAVRIWTNKRVLWVTQYDGATGLDSSARNPCAHMPNMPGG